jgi:hypothetical protein
MVRLPFANGSQKVLDHEQTEVATILALDHPAVFTSKRPYALDFQSTRATSNASSTNKISQGANQKISNDGNNAINYGNLAFTANIHCDL